MLGDENEETWTELFTFIGAFHTLYTPSYGTYLAVKFSAWASVASSFWKWFWSQIPTNCWQETRLFQRSPCQSREIHDKLLWLIDYKIQIDIFIKTKKPDLIRNSWLVACSWRKNYFLWIRTSSLIYCSNIWAIQITNSLCNLKFKSQKKEKFCK